MFRQNCVSKFPSVREIVGNREMTTIDYRGYKRNRVYSNRSCTHPTSTKYTTESVKECYDNDTKV